MYHQHYCRLHSLACRSAAAAAAAAGAGAAAAAAKAKARAAKATVVAAPSSRQSSSLMTIARTNVSRPTTLATTTTTTTTTTKSGFPSSSSSIVAVGHAKPFSQSVGTTKYDTSKTNTTQNSKSVIIPTPFKTFEEIHVKDDLLPPGAPDGCVPTDLNQATGLERMEILAELEGKTLFDMRPLDSSRTGTMKDPIVVDSHAEERYLGCAGLGGDSHLVRWLTVSKTRPIERCTECGSVYKMNYVESEDSTHAQDHGHDHHGQYQEPKTFVDYIKPEDLYR